MTHDPPSPSDFVLENPTTPSGFWTTDTAFWASFLLVCVLAGLGLAWILLSRFFG